MKLSRLPVATVVVALFSIFGAGSASAELAKTYVSATGSDSNSCAFATPCLTFQKAHDTTSSGGEVYALTSTSDFGALTVTKSITFYAMASDPAARPSISVATGNAITVNAGANDTVTFVNLALDGQTTAANGIQFNTGSELASSAA